MKEEDRMSDAHRDMRVLERRELLGQAAPLIPSFGAQN